MTKPSLTANQLQRLMRDRDLGFKVETIGGDDALASVWISDGDGDLLILVRSGMNMGHLAARQELAQQIADLMNEGEVEVANAQRSLVV